MSVLDPRTLRVLWMIATTSRFRKGLRLDYVGRELEIRAEAGAGAKLQATAADLDAHVGVPSGPQWTPAARRNFRRSSRA